MTGSPTPARRGSRASCTLHVGTAALPVRTQRLADGRVRLRLPRPVPLVPGDRAVLRDPGLHEVLAGVEVAVVDPPTRRDRRAATRGTGESDPLPGPTATRRRCDRGAARHTGARRTGWPPTRCRPRPATSSTAGRSPPATSPTPAERGEVIALAGLVLAGDVLATAERVVRQLPQPFTVGDAARALGTSRRVAVPLLERLDAALVTRRLPDGTPRGAAVRP